MHDTVVDSICWALVAVVWLAGALYNRTNAPRTRRVSRFWLGSILAVAAAWGLLGLIPVDSWTRLVFDPLWLRVLGAVLICVSTGFTVWARFALGRMWSGSPSIKEGHELRTSGPYKVTRHPIYTGIFGMILGTTLEHGFGKVTPFLLLALVVFEVKIQVEERLLKETFDGAYLSYMRSVPQLIPGLKWPVR